VPELDSCLERAVILAGSTIEPAHLNLPTTPLQVRPEAPADPWDQIDLSGTLDDATRRRCWKSSGARSPRRCRRAATTRPRRRDLGMAPRLLVKKIRSLALTRSFRAT
jgi:hypothetical protein